MLSNGKHRAPKGKDTKTTTKTPERQTIPVSCCCRNGRVWDAGTTTGGRPCPTHG